MKKAAFWKADWFVGLLVVLAFLGATATSDRLDLLEGAVYDMGVRATDRTPSDKIAVIAIDEASIKNIGRWPWSRDVHAKMADKLATAQAKVVVNTTLFLEPQIDPGLKYINQLHDIYQTAVKPPAAAPTPTPTPDATGVVPTPAPEPVAEPLAAPVVSPEMEKMGQVLRDARVALNTDQLAAASFQKAGHVVVPMVFTLGQPQGNPDQPLPDYLTRFALPKPVLGSLGESLPEPALTALPPIEPIGKSVQGIGFLNSALDADGAARKELLLVRYFDQIYPSLAVVTALRSLNLDVKDVKVVPGQSVELGRLKVATSNNYMLHTYFYKSRQGTSPFPVDSYFDVISGKIPLEKYKGKVVLIGATATGVGETFATPVSPSAAPVEILAHSVSSLLSEHFFVRPNWASWLNIALVLLIAVYLMALLPRMKAGLAALVSGGALVLLLGFEMVMMTTQLTWIPLVSPALLLLIGHLLLTTKRFLVTERGKESAEAQSAESNRLVGLARQGKGELDEAFSYFRRCPMDASMMDLLYNLALDYERKRQFNKAASVFEHMATYDPKYRDISQRINRAKQMENTVILGGAGGRSNASTLILEGGDIEKPMLGRYQVEKELGKGAMGVVYLGKDPKIGRVVAIKTMTLSQEFEGDELEEARERFFREAETAGRLSHPNIVTIFDAGEEHDLAYIAMEFLKGKDLVPYVKKDVLLPLDKVVKIVAQVADALFYAHQAGVVHRDIKPANIMYEPESETVKVTDFGIARITDSSKTKTGMVLGTPSYMSPEQLSGKKIDGRSDLFSLGVTLYQMSVGQLPFTGDSMTELMFRIANEPQRSPLEIRPDLPPAVVEIIDKSLQKDPAMRYQNGREMAQALEQCLAAMKG